MTTRRQFLAIAGAGLALAAIQQPLAQDAVATPVDAAVAEIGPEKMARLLCMDMRHDPDAWYYFNRTSNMLLASIRGTYDLGRPGLDDIEAAITLNALIASASDPRLSWRTTRHAQAALAALHGYVAHKGTLQGQITREQYGYLAMVGEKAIQLIRLGGNGIAEDIRNNTVDWQALRNLFMQA